MGTTTDEYIKNPKEINPSSSSLQKGDRKPLPNKLKYLTAIIIFVGNVTFGCGFTSYGPALTSLQNKYGVEDSTISTVFTVLLCGYLVGGLGGGIIYNYVNRQLAVTILFALMAVLMFITPHMPTLTTFFISAAVMGICGGSYDAAQVVWMMEMMQKACPPYVLAQHFFYAVGTILSSSIMAPFLPHNEDDDEEDEEKSILKSEETEEETKLYIPYSIIGSMLGAVAAAHLLLFVFMRYRPPPPEILDETENVNENLDEKNKNESSGIRIGKWSLRKFRTVILTAFFFGAYVGMEMCTFDFFSKFGQNSNLKLSEKRAAYTLTAMNATYAAFRGVGIIIAFKVRPQYILLVNLFFVTVANILLVGWASNSLPVLWTCSIMYGLGFSTIYPAFCAYIERYLRFTNFIGGLMIVFGSGVAALYPVIIGKFIEENPVVLSYTGFFSIFLMLLSLGTLSYLTHKNKTRY